MTQIAESYVATSVFLLPTTRRLGNGSIVVARLAVVNKERIGRREEHGLDDEVAAARNLWVRCCDRTCKCNQASEYIARKS